MAWNIPDRVLREIRLFAYHSNIDRVVLFGSRARGTHTERSDIDIAVSGGDFDAFYWDIKEKIHSLLCFDVVDYDKSAGEDLKKRLKGTV